MSADAFLNNMMASKLFQGLHVGQMDLFFRLAKLKIYQAGQVVVAEGDVAKDFFWIEDGRLNVEISQRDGQEKILVNTIKQGELFGEMALLGIEKRTATVSTKDDCQLYRWNAADCLKFFEANKEIGFYVMKNLASILGSRVRDMNLLLRNYAEKIEPGIPYFD